MIVHDYATFKAIFNPGGAAGVDGLPVWPYSTKVNQAGFTNTMQFRTFGLPFISPWRIYVDTTSDPTPGLDRYDWYLSQRTDDATKQYFSVVRQDTSMSNTKSGQIGLALTSIATTLYPTLTTDAKIALFNDLNVYVRRRSDGLIQHRLLTEVLFGETEFVP